MGRRRVIGEFDYRGRDAAIDWLRRGPQTQEPRIIFSGMHLPAQRSFGDRLMKNSPFPIIWSEHLYMMMNATRGVC